MFTKIHHKEQSRTAASEIRVGDAFAWADRLGFPMLRVSPIGVERTVIKEIHYIKLGGLDCGHVCTIPMDYPVLRLEQIGFMEFKEI